MTVVERHYTVKEIADLLGFTERYIRQLIAEGLLPARKIGRSVRVPDGGLSDFLEARKLVPKKLLKLQVA